MRRANERPPHSFARKCKFPLLPENGRNGRAQNYWGCCVVELVVVVLSRWISSVGAADVVVVVSVCFTCFLWW
jgi:hypothetical protein